VDVNISQNIFSSVSSFTAPTFSIKTGNELLIAMIASDNTRTTQSVKSVSGGSLTWRLAMRTNKQGGTAEIWYAFTAKPIASVSVSAKLAQSATGQITVMSFSNVDTGNGGLAAIGAVVSASGAASAPMATVVPTRAGSLVVGVANDPQTAAGRTPGPGQALVQQFVQWPNGTMWVQGVDHPVQTAGVPVVLNDLYPAYSSYNFSVIEVRGPLVATSLAAPPPADATASSLSAASVSDAVAPVAATDVPEVTLVHPVTYQPADVCSADGLATLVGKDFTSQAPQSVVNASLPTKLAGVQVQINGQYARLMMASAEQIYFLCPDLAIGTPLDIEVITESGKLLRAPLSSMRAAAPALFTVPDSMQAVLQLADSDQPQQGLTQTVRRGDTIRLHPAGLGAVGTPVTVGEVAPLDRKILLQNSLKVVINGVEIDPVFAGLAPGTVGLYQVDVRIPADAPVATDVPLSLKVRLADGTEVLSNPATIAIGAPALQGRR
jgi:uncharacterized protein (TIGR03437 family)